MAPLLHHALLGLAVWALASAGWRVAADLTPVRLERWLAAAPLAVAAAVAEALLLGRLGLGGSAPALTGAALATWLAARFAWPRIVPGAPPARLPLTTRAAAGAAAGLAAAWVIGILRLPALNADALTYHLAEVAGWVAGGETGARDPGIYGVPVEAYPKAWEVTVAWAAGIAHSPGVAAPAMLAAAALIAAGAYGAARALAVPPLVAALAGALLATLPPVLAQLGGPNTDVPALGWLGCTAALALAARARPGLLAPALVAAGLAIGTKPTTAPLVLAALLAARPRAADPRALLAAGALAAVVGATWYVRNLVLHGSPLWPFFAGPGGDPVPRLFRELGATFLSDPAAALSGRAGQYAEVLGGGLLLLAAAPLAVLADRRRATVVTAAVAAISLLLWARAPFTGEQGDPELDVLVVGGVRYALPALAAVALVVALAGRRRPRAAAAVLGAGVLFNLVRLADLPYPDRPRLWLLAAGVAAGAHAALAPLPPLPRRAAPVAALAATAAALALAAPGYWARHPGVRLPDAGAVRFLESRRGEVAMAPVRFASLAGDDLRRRVTLIGQRETCAALARRRARGGWVVLVTAPQPRAFTQPATAPGCLRGERPAYADGSMAIYAPG